jgi:hypothetical protein
MHACTVVLRISRALKAREPSNLFFTCILTRTHVRMTVECVSCVRPVVPYQNNNNNTSHH